MQRRNLLVLVILIALSLPLLTAFAGLAKSLEPGANVEEPAPSHEDIARFQQVAEVLRNSETGRMLLALKEAYQVDVKFEAGAGSRFRREPNLILLDADHEPMKAALYFAHEMHHARYLHEGRKAELKVDSRQDYISKKLREEAEGMVVSIQVKMELEAADLPASEITLPLETLYRAAHQAAVEGASSGMLVPDEADLGTIGETAGEQALFKAFASGEVKTSNSYEPYPDYYGRDWDEAHLVKAYIAGLLTGGTL